MTSQTPKGKLSKKLLATIIIVVVIVASASAAAAYMLSKSSSSNTPNLPAMSLTLVGADGTQKVLTQTDIAGLKSYTANGGFKSSGGMIAAVGTYIGVPVTTLINLVGGMTSGETLTVTASDGYSMVYTFNQVMNGQDFTCYDPVTGSEKTPTHSMQLVLTYKINGTDLASGDGPLRMGVLGSDGLLTEGHFWVKMVNKIEVTSNVRDWTVTVKATTDLNMTRQAFTAEYNHYGISYTDTSGNIWTGTALWRWVSWSNYNGGVSNSSLDQGYTVKVISGDGSSATFTSSQVANNNNIIMATELNNATLTDPYWPITIVGSDVSAQNSIKNIVAIQIIINSQTTTTPTATPTSTPTPTPTPTATPVSWTLTVNGTSAVTMSQTDFATQVSGSTATYTDNTGTVWSGTPLHRLALWAQNNGAISSSLLTSGYVVKVIGSGGTFATFNDTLINMNTNIMVANTANGAAITGTNAPLVLTGSQVVSSSSQKIVGITQIQIIPLQSLNLTLVGPSGTVTLFSNDIIALSSYTANGGTRSSSGTLANYGSYTGVPITTLCNLVGGLTSSNTITVTGSDGYTSTYSYGQVTTGQGILFYDANGTQTTPTQSVTMIVAYFLNGANIPSGTGPLRTIAVGADGLYSTGSTSAKLVAKITIN